MLRFSIEYFAAGVTVHKALRYRAQRDEVAIAPVNFLLGHSIELSLKAYLLKRGKSVEYLRKNIGHRLRAALAAANQEGLAEHFAIDDADAGMLGALDAMYSRKEFEYIEIGPRVLPVYEPLRFVANELIVTVMPLIPYGSVLLRSNSGRLLTL